MTAWNGRRALQLGASVLLALAIAACRSSQPFEKQPGRGQNPIKGAPEKEKPIVESEIQPPPYPKNADLLEFKLRGQTTNHFYIDGSSLTVIEGKIVRFVLVIRTSDDVSNVRYAGLQCADHQWKDYAFARADHTWAMVADPQWVAIPDLTFNDYQQTLYKDYFCAGGAVWSGTAGDARKLVRLLKYPPAPDPRVPGTRPY
jgi:hypothetical protein